MAVPVIKGHKTPGERFAGALDTQRVIDRAHECIPRVYRDWTV
jgi:hypothetical protein